MLSRRLIRIKILQMLYAYIKSGSNSPAKAEKDLFFSLNKTFDLYLYLLLFLIEVYRFAEDRIELARQKKIPTYEDLHPNTKFIDNKIIQAIYNNDDFNKLIAEKKISWVQHPELIKTFYKHLINTQLYEKYMASKDSTIEEDLALVNNLYKNEIIKYLDLHMVLEEESIFWNDDVEFIIGIIRKSLKDFVNNNNNLKLGPLFKNDEDIEFTKKLFRKAILNHKGHLQLIDEFTVNWDVERIAFMDILVLSQAITEITEFSSIPVKVTFNEYLEISKQYSTPNSSSFINGVLDKIVQKLKNEKKIQKMGRGLVGEE